MTAPWNTVLLAAAAFAAVMSLVRLMVARRNRLVAELRLQAEAEAQRNRRKDAHRDSREPTGKRAG